MDLFHAKSGANSMVSGLFMGKTLVYSDLNHVVVRILPKYVSEAREHSILVSSHIDTVFSTYVFFIYLLPYFCSKQSIFWRFVFNMMFTDYLDALAIVTQFTDPKVKFWHLRGQTLSMMS